MKNSQKRSKIFGYMVQLYEGIKHNKVYIQFFLEIYFDELKKRLAKRETFPAPLFRSMAGLVKSFAPKINANTQTWRKENFFSKIEKRIILLIFSKKFFKFFERWQCAFLLFLKTKWNSRSKASTRTQSKHFRNWFVYKKSICFLKTASVPSIMESRVTEKLVKIIFYLARKREDPVFSFLLFCLLLLYNLIIYIKKGRLEATKSLMKISSAKILNKNAKEEVKIYQKNNR